jgi:hypothetical protein
MDKKELEDAVEMIKLAGDMEPLAGPVVDAVLKYGPHFYRLLEAAQDGLVDLQVRAIKRYEDAGFSRDDAILLNLNTRLALQQGLAKQNKGQ